MCVRYLASVLPNTWAHWTATAGATWAAKEVYTPQGNQAWCDAQGCPEFANWPTFFLTTSLKLGPHVWIKLYPDIRIYYAAFYVITALGVVCTHTPALRRALHARCRLPWPLAAVAPRGLVEHGAISAGALLVAATLAALLALEAIYWWGAHDFSNKTTDPKQRWARQLGQMANVLMGLLALPVSRNSIWAELVGISWEIGISLHRLLGYAFLAVGLAHMGFWWSVWADAGTFPHGT
jgi:hypothetical protein